MAEKRIKLPSALIAKTWWRTFFLQASWNFEGLQCLGVLYALAPALRYLYRNRPEELAAAYRRHLQYFNTQPYMASPVLGVMLELEAQRSRGCEGALDVQEFRGMVMGPYAAMGDAFFWGGLRPLASVVALLFALQGILWAPLLFLLLFNLPHLWLRVSGGMRGYERGLAVVEIVRRWSLPDRAIYCKEATVVLLGGLSAYLVAGCFKQEGLLPLWGVMVLPLIAAVSWVARKGISPLTILLAASVIVLLLPQLR